MKNVERSEIPISEATSGKPPSEYLQLKKKYKSVLDNFKKYLQKQDYEENTKNQYLNYTAYYLEWMNRQKLAENQIHYSDLLSYINYCRSKNNSTMLINRKLAAIRKYYEHLQFNGEKIKNPASGLYLKGKRTNVPGNLLDKETLKQLYENYQVFDLRTARNKIIISLLIHQAVTTDELHKLEPTHIKLKSGKIEIPGSKHSNGRTLKLESHQIMELQEYLFETRPAILKGIKENPSWPGRPARRSVSAGRKAEKPDFKLLEDRLFISMNGGSSLKNTLRHMTIGLKQINPKVKDIRQIRQSVITEWLKVKEIRTVQYMAGHRYVSTTERYQATNLEDLEEALKVHHPLQ